MSARDPEARLVSPGLVLEEIARSVLGDCLGHMTIIGSLAAGWRFFGDRKEMLVQTKDADCLLSPHFQAIPRSAEIVERLFQDDWSYHASEDWPSPGTPSTPGVQLPAIRLDPPNAEGWFLELLSTPPPGEGPGQIWSRVSTSRGDFGICSFRFSALLTLDPLPTPHGLAVARPEFLVLANLLEHSAIRPDTMSGLIGGRRLKRSNKDLGRVLAIAWLSEREDEDALMSWPETWSRGLKTAFPELWPELAAMSGDGLRELLEERHTQDFEEACHTCRNGLLARRPHSARDLRAAGLRLLEETERLKRGPS